MHTNFSEKMNFIRGVTVKSEHRNDLFVTLLLMSLSYQAWLLLWLKFCFCCLQCKEILSTLIIPKDFPFHHIEFLSIQWLSPFFWFISQRHLKVHFSKGVFFFQYFLDVVNIFLSYWFLSFFPSTNANYFTRVNWNWLIYFCLAVSMHILLLCFHNLSHQHY